MSPMVTVTASASGFVRSCSAMWGDSSMPFTGTPRALNGRATRPVPTANSSAAPPRAVAAKKSTIGLRTDGSNIVAEVTSYTSATSLPHVIDPTAPASQARPQSPIRIFNGATFAHSPILTGDYPLLEGVWVEELTAHERGA